MVFPCCLWTLLWHVLVYCTIPQKTGCNEAVKYQGFLGIPRSLSRLNVHNQMQTAGFRPRSAVKGSGAPYSDFLSSQVSSLMQEPPVNAPRYASAVKAGGNPIIREQVKLVPVLHLQQTPSVTQSPVIQFGSFQSGSASHAVDQWFGGPAPAWGGGTQGSAASPTWAGANQISASSSYPSAQAPTAARSPTQFFGSGHGTGASYSSGPSYGHFGGSAQWNPSSPATASHGMSPATALYTYGGSAPQTSSSQFNTNAAVASMSGLYSHTVPLGAHGVLPPQGSAAFVPTGTAQFLGSSAHFNAGVVKPDSGLVGGGAGSFGYGHFSQLGSSMPTGYNPYSPTAHFVRVPAGQSRSPGSQSPCMGTRCNTWPTSFPV